MTKEEFSSLEIYLYCNKSDMKMPLQHDVLCYIIWLNAKKTA